MMIDFLLRHCKGGIPLSRFEEVLGKTAKVWTPETRQTHLTEFSFHLNRRGKTPTVVDRCQVN
jgi:hypothetical protein